MVGNRVDGEEAVGPALVCVVSEVMEEIGLATSLCCVDWMVVGKENNWESDEFEVAVGDLRGTQ